MSKIQLNDLQKEAVEYLDGPLLVLAGPGTGKTQLLSSKVAHILTHTDTAPENILCLTFTENGATNMRTRLLSLIGPEARHINIHTYHAFGQSIIAQYKNYNPLYPRRLEGTVDEVTKFKIVHEIQTKLPALDILKNDNTSDILATISSAKSARLTPNDLTKIAEANNQASASLNSELTPVLEQLVPRMKFADALAQVYQPLAEILTKYTSDQPIVGNIEPEANYMLRSLVEIIDTEQAKDKPSVSPLTKWKNAHFEKDEADHYRLSNRVANLKLASLAGIMQQYNDYLTAHALYDFDDMIEESISFLRNDTGFRLTLSERYQYILLDEFQDTNPSQFEIIRLLTNYEQPAVMAVGDDDQAIFEFQGASASNLLDFQNHYDAKVITLLDNYRSNSEILDFSHRVAQQIDDSFAKKHGIAKKLVARLKGNYKNFLKNMSEPIQRHEFISADAEYYWVAEQIRHLVDAGTDPSEIAVITPKHKYIAPLLPYLKAQNLSVAYEKRSDVLQDPQIHQLLTLARFVHAAAHVQPTAHQLLEILSFPFWQVNALAAIQTIHQAQHDKKSAFDYLASSKDEKIQKIAHFLAELVKISYDTPLELFLDYLIGVVPLGEYQSPFLTHYSSGRVTSASICDDGSKRNEEPRNDGSDEVVAEEILPETYKTFELYENLSTLRSTLINHTKATQPKLADLIHFLDDYELAGAGLVSTSPYQDDSSSVQVMTAFKSKGLEFQHVFLIAVDSLSWGKAKGNNNTLTLPKNLIQIRHTGITDDERLRVFFVALTRAKQTLTLTNSIKDFAGKSPARLEYLAEYEDGDDVISPYLPEPNQKVIRHYDDLAAAKRQTDLHAHWSAAYHRLTPELKPLLQAKLENYRLTASDLTSFIDLQYGGPLEFYNSRILGAPREPATPQTILGNLIHATFEKVTKEGITDQQALEFFQQELARQPLDQQQQTDLSDKGSNSLQKSLQKFGTLLRSDHARAEVNLSPERPHLGDIPLTGKLDHIQIDDQHKTIEVYDFKTGSYHDNAWNSHPTLYKYRLQLGFYKLLLNNSPTYRNYTVTRGHILFVTPKTNEDTVHDKVYEFNDTDETELKSLITAVYQQIKSLAFLDDPDLAIYPDKNATLKQLKEFVKLLLAKNTKV